MTAKYTPTNPRASAAARRRAVIDVDGRIVQPTYMSPLEEA
jgi:hypothetical protein